MMNEASRSPSVPSVEGASPSLGEHLEDIYTLSPLQQGMLYHISSAPGSRLYVDQSVCTLSGALDTAAFQSAWSTVVARHPALRTAFLWEGLSKPVQVVYRRADPLFEELDWRSLSPRVQEAQLQAFLRQDRQRGFDLTTAPLMRLHLIRTGEREYSLLWTVSHLVVDAWCSSIILDEVIRHYEAHRQGVALHLDSAPRYRDYIAWLKNQDLSRAESFWRSYLDGFSKPTAIGQEDMGSGGAGGHRHETGQLSELNTAALRRVARQVHLTVNTLVQGAWALTLGFQAEGWDQETDVVFGATVSGRPPELPGADATVGLFINTLPQRARIDLRQPLAKWLADLQHQQLEMRQFEYTPLSKLQSWCEVPTGTPLFDTNLVFLNVFDVERQDTGSLRLDGLRHVGRPHYPLTVNVTPGPRLKVELIYDVQRLRWRSVRNLIDRFTLLLGSFAARPNASVGMILDGVRGTEREKEAEARKKRRDSNTDRLRITRPVAIKLPN